MQRRARPRSWPAQKSGAPTLEAPHLGHHEALRRAITRSAYLLGQVDVLPLGGFDASPTAMAQGPTRRTRGEAFFKYVTETLGAKHHAIIVPECGHNDRCMFTSDVVLPVIFPK